MTQNNENHDILDVMNANFPPTSSSTQPLGISQNQKPIPSEAPTQTLKKEKKSGLFSEPTLEEKIDYIYASLKAQKRNARIKLSLKIFVIIAIYYFVVVMIPSMPQDKIDGIKNSITGVISDQVSAIAKPMIEDMKKDMLGDTTSEPSASKVDELLKKYPHLKDKIKQ